MILEPDVPKYVRNWAVCQVNLRCAERALESLITGEPTCFIESMFIKLKGQKKFIEERAKPQIPKLERRCRRYRALIRALAAHGSPLQYLLSRREMRELIGHTLHYTDRRRYEIYRTLQYCSSDGKKLFSQGWDPTGSDELDLLGFGFGHVPERETLSRSRPASIRIIRSRPCKNSSGMV